MNFITGAGGGDGGGTTIFAASVSTSPGNFTTGDGGPLPTNIQAGKGGGNSPVESIPISSN